MAVKKPLTVSETIADFSGARIGEKSPKVNGRFDPLHLVGVAITICYII
jgi:hypothetical protein